MSTFLSFLTDNFLWLFIGGLVIVFALIGYLVDVTEIRKKKDLKKKKIS